MKQLALVMLDWLKASLQLQSPVSETGGVPTLTTSESCEELQTLTQAVGAENKNALPSQITSRCALQRLVKAATDFLKTADKIKVDWIGFPDEASLEEYYALASLNGSVVWAGMWGCKDGWRLLLQQCHPSAVYTCINKIEI